MWPKTSTAIFKAKLGFQSSSLGCYILTEDWEHRHWGSNGVRPSECRFRGCNSWVSPKASLPHLYSGSSGHSIRETSSRSCLGSPRFQRLSSHAPLRAVSLPTPWQPWAGFKRLNLITNPYCSLPSPQCSWQGLDTDISSWKIMHCQVGKLQAVISNTCIRYFKHGTSHRLDINLYNGDRKG